MKNRFHRPPMPIASLQDNSILSTENNRAGTSIDTTRQNNLWSNFGKLCDRDKVIVEDLINSLLRN